MHKISKLPPEIQKRICAGEVIVSPYNVLKELIENSIDANPSSIQIILNKDNLNLEVHDDGCGIHESDFVNLALPHYTSKYEESSYGWNSLGFRGEALASIRCVSNLIIKSKITDSEVGFVKDFSKNVIKPVSMNNGTSIIINNLFYNNKIREKCFYKKLAVYKSMNELVHSFALKNPRIRFQLNNETYVNDESFNDKEGDQENFESFQDLLINFKNDIPVFKSKEDPITKFRSRQVSSIFNISPIRHYSKDFITIIFTPSMVNYKSFLFILFINNRLVTNQNIKSAISKIYLNILPKGRHPFVYLDLRIPPVHVDVNVHPSKKEVLIEYEDLLIEIINLILTEGLNEQKSVYKPNTNTSQNTDLIYKEYNTLEDCIIKKNHKEYKLLSIISIKNEIVEVDTSFIKDLVYVGVSNIPDEYLLVQYNQYLMKCKMDIIRPILIYHYFVYNFGNFYSISCKIKNPNLDKFKGMLSEYFQIEVEDGYLIRIPLLDDNFKGDNFKGDNFKGCQEEWESLTIESDTEESVFREIFYKMRYIFKDLKMDRNIFSIMKRDLKCTKEVLESFTILKSLKDLYKCFERC